MITNRQTGRTTRLLMDAIKQAKDGRAVYVIASNQRHRDTVEKQLHELCADLSTSPHTLGIKVETPQSLGNFDWDSLRLVGAHPNCVVLVDHYAIETRFARILEMLHRYDVVEERKDDS